jgi:hypothetical protein
METLTAEPKTLETDQKTVTRICKKFGDRPFDICTGMYFSRFYSVYIYRAVGLMKPRYFLVQQYTTETDDGTTRGVSTWANGVIEYANQEDLDYGMAYIHSILKERKESGEARIREYIEKLDGERYTDLDFKTFTEKKYEAFV